MARLHIGHYNTYMLDRILKQIDNNSGIFSAAPAAAIEALQAMFAQPFDRVDQLCAQIVDAPYDVICLNEVFDEESRDQFIKRLSEEGPYPHHTEVLGNAVPASIIEGAITALFPVLQQFTAFIVRQLVNLMKSSGLLLFSKHPFVAISEDTFCEFVEYKDAAEDDRFAPKGGAAVVIQPFDYPLLVIGFTHLQADYHDKDPHPVTRAKQIKQWWQLMESVAKKTGAKHLIACGDLNIIGNVDDSNSDEFHNIFQSETHPFSQILKDQWLETHSPADAFITHPGSSERLDYMLVGTLLKNPAPPGTTGGRNRTIVAHHLMLARNLWTGVPQIPTPFSEPGLPAKLGSVPLSDHIGVNAVINFRTHHCTPRLAQAVKFKNDVFKQTFLLAGGGAYFWFVIKEEGTYFVKLTPGGDLEKTGFEATDLSAGIIPVEPIDWKKADQRELGSRFSLPSSPSFVRVRQLQVTEQSLGREITVTKASGQSKKMAVYLNGAKRYGGQKFPLDSALNEDDTMWFEARPNEPTVAKTSQTIRITVRWKPTSKTPAQPFELRLENAQGKELGKVVCSDPKGSVLSVVLPKAAPVYPRVRRLGKLALAPEFEIGWQSDLTLLHGPVFADRQVPNAGSLELEATDETGSDFAGSDEPVLNVTIDGKVTRTQSYEDVDSGTRVAINEIVPLGFLGYRKGVAVSLHEGEGEIGGDQSADGTQPPLDSGAPQPVHTTMFLDIGNGNYELRYNLSHWQEAAPLPKQHD